MVLIHINMEKKTDQTETDVMNNYISRRDLIAEMQTYSQPKQVLKSDTTFEAITLVQFCCNIYIFWPKNAVFFAYQSMKSF